MDIPSDDDEEETLLFNLAYCSRAVPHLGSADIDLIVGAARRNNARRAITGWLVYSDGIFFQWLEGMRDDVEHLMASITADKRHDTIVVLSEAEEVRTRLFSEWDMELVSADDIRTILFDAIGESHESKSIEALQLLLKELDSRAVGARA